MSNVKGRVLARTKPKAVNTVMSRSLSRARFGFENFEWSCNRSRTVYNKHPANRLSRLSFSDKEKAKCYELTAESRQNVNLLSHLKAWL